VAVGVVWVVWGVGVCVCSSAGDVDAQVDEEPKYFFGVRLVG
jgi:hypothetical protein